MQELNAVIAQKTVLTPRLMIMRVVANGWQLPHFEAGQYVVLGLPPTAPRSALSAPEIETPAPDKLIRRAYSIASSSLLGEYMDFYISLVSNGTLTPRLFALNVGDRLWLSPHPVGMFTLADVPAHKNIVLVATGTGLAPYMSMLSTHLDCGGARRMAVLHGAFHSWDLGYRAELETMQHLCPNLTYIPTIDRPEDEPVAWHGRTGWVQQLWQAGVVAETWGFQPTPKNTDVFLCGVPGMIADMLTMLTAAGFSEHSHGRPGEIHVERY
ncbi:MAG: ferredoxin--NADP reductase [Ardenticatenaceae bacterium]|nr:ferredoxin--NADP reductase [Anaerolineales bacterium]MCB8920287.1 ferredoxin--NADP reductase [Ardenticatenaceae bacterium]